MLKRGILQLALTVLLLLGQQAALVHALHHLTSPASSTSQERSKDTGGDSRLCAFHSTCAQLLGGVNAPSAPLLLAVNLFEQVAGRDVLRFGSAPLSLHSRSPPALP
jgi:hypothetical protein